VQSAQLQQQYVFMPQKVKEVYLAHTLNLMREPEWGVRSVVLFVGTCQACQTLSLVLAELGLPHSALHAALSQLQRGAALDAFRSGRSPVLVRTGPPCIFSCEEYSSHVCPLQRRRHLSTRAHRVLHVTRRAGG
jgi:superfamily II DNA/RNA helicase